jgi:restriction system protein
MGAILLTADEIRAKIAEALRDTIDDYRAARAKRDPRYDRPFGDLTEEEVDEFIAANPDLEFEHANMLGRLGKGDKFAVRVRSEVFDDFDDALAEKVRELAGGQIADESVGGEFDEVPEGLQPTERRLWIPEDRQPRPQWLDTSRSALLLAQQLIEDGRLLSEMDWRAFEKLIAELLERDGWNIQLMRGTKDGGIDVVSTRADPAVGALKAIWQAKRYGEGRKVQLSQARELSGVIERERASKGVLVTTTSLTRGALDWVKQDEFRLSAKDGNEVRRWVEKYAD